MMMVRMDQISNFKEIVPSEWRNSQIKEFNKKNFLKLFYKCQQK